MRTLLFVLIATLSCLNADAQYQALFSDSAKTHTIEIGSDYSIGSNILSTEFFNAFYLKNNISNDLKNSIIKNIGNVNALGGDFNYGISYTHFKPNDSLFCMKNAGYYIGFKDRQHINTQFSGDLFTLFFDGNQSYRGKTATLSHFEYNSLRYQQVEFGLIKKIVTEERQYIIGGGLSLLNGQSHTAIATNEASLYTEIDGEYIDFKTDMTVNRSDTAKRNWGAMNGLGTSARFFVAYTSNAGSTLKFEVSDLGLIRWNKQSSVVTLDTALRFEGMQVNNIFNFSDPAYSDVPSDTGYINSFIKNTKYGSYNSILPAWLELSYSKKVNKYTLLTGIKYRILANYIPYMYMGFKYTFSPKLYTSATLGYGGYTRLNGGLELGYDCCGFTLTLGSQFIYGYINPASSTAQGAYVSLRKNF